MTRGSLLPPFKPVQLISGLVVFVALMAVFFGNLARQRSERQRVSEVRNLQQWGIALNLYLIENENELPGVGTIPVTPDQKKAWFNALPPYISETPLADLPAGSRPRPGVPSLWTRPTNKPVKIWDPEVFYFEFGMNRYLQPVEGVRSFRIYELSNPGNIVFLLPVADYVPTAEPSNLAVVPGVPLNVLFCDGHVQAVPPTVLRSPDSLSAGAAESGPSWFQK